jgi:hypothetical protein
VSLLHCLIQTSLVTELYHENQGSLLHCFKRTSLVTELYHENQGSLLHCFKRTSLVTELYHENQGSLLDCFIRIRIDSGLYHENQGTLLDCFIRIRIDSGLYHENQGSHSTVSHGSESMLPTGRNFGRKTKKWPHKNLSGRKKLRPNFWPIFQEMAEKWPNFYSVCTSHKGLNYLKKLTSQPMGSLHYFCY